VVDGDVDADEYGAMKNATAEALKKYGLAYITIEIEITEEICRDDTEQQARPTDRTNWPDRSKLLIFAARDLVDDVIHMLTDY